MTTMTKPNKICYDNNFWLVNQIHSPKRIIIIYNKCDLYNSTLRALRLLRIIIIGQYIGENRYSFDLKWVHLRFFFIKFMSEVIRVCFEIVTDRSGLPKENNYYFGLLWFLYVYVSKLYGRPKIFQK